MVEHHLVVLPTDARLFVPPEGGMCRIHVIAVGPHATGLETPPDPVGTIAVAGPYAGTQPVQSVVGDLERLVLSLESGDRDHGAENLFLEDAHLIVALEDGR